MAENVRDDIPKTVLGNYHLERQVTINDETWEFWRWGAEPVVLRYKAGSEVVDFQGELLGWDRILKLHVEILMPAQLKIGDKELDAAEVHALAARMHLALGAMKKPNVIAWRIPWEPLPQQERGTVLADFKKVMTAKGFVVQAEPDDVVINIKRKGFSLFRRKPTEAEILELGTLIAKGFRTLLYKESDRTLLFVSEGARPVTSWLAGIEW